MKIENITEMKNEIEEWFKNATFLNDLHLTIDVLRKIEEKSIKKQSIQKQIAYELGMTSYNVCRKVKKLMNHDLIKMIPQHWYIDFSGKKRADTKAKLLELTAKGYKVIEYLKINPLPERKKKITKERINKKVNNIQLSALEYHSSNLRELVLKRFIAEFPIIKTDGIYDGSLDFVNTRYDGGNFSIEESEVLYNDFLENHIEFITYKDFNSLITQFKEISKEWWQAYDTVIKGIILDLEHYFGLPYSHRDDKQQGYTLNLINWIVEGMKCKLDEDCNKHYFDKYYVDNENNKVVGVKMGNINLLEYRNANGCLIFDKIGNSQREDFKINMDNKLSNYMLKKLTEAPYFKIYKEKIEMLSKAEKLRNDIIMILKKNQQIPLFNVRNCLYLKVMHPDIDKRK